MQVLATLYGWISGKWQKNPLLLGYSGDQTEKITIASASAGKNTLSGTNVPSGEIWVIQAASLVDNTSSPNQLEILLNVNAIDIAISMTTPAFMLVPLPWTGAAVLSEGDSVDAIVWGATAGDKLILAYHAMRVDIDR